MHKGNNSPENQCIRKCQQYEFVGYPTGGVTGVVWKNYVTGRWADRQTDEQKTAQNQYLHHKMKLNKELTNRQMT